jgi:hypothetical protein
MAMGLGTGGGTAAFVSRLSSYQGQPAGGVLTLHDMPQHLRDQIAGLIRNEEASESAEHPLND